MSQDISQLKLETLFPESRPCRPPDLYSSIAAHRTDFTVKLYLQICGLDEDWQREELKEKLKWYPMVRRELKRYFDTNESKLTFLQRFSDEQIKYITNLSIEHTKLIACAGSGKTRSIIGRIKFIVEHGFVKRDEVFAITFSKHAANDFHLKIQELFPDCEKFCQLNNFSTIDSLAKSILCKVKSHKSENVEILSIAFRNYLRDASEEEIEFVRSIKNVRYLFVDEAQDLNDVQYDIITLLRTKMGTICELCGDPNQNIYQFRRSSSSYLINFPAKEFQLTLNFRSTQEIINFAESFKTIPTPCVRSATRKHGPKVTIITKSITDIHQLIIKFIRLYQRKMDISNIAIICPCRGIGSYDSVGLSVFFNLFKLHKVPFNQLYDESGLNDERKKDVNKKPGHINLITYHGTKGLEFDVVFVMDFYQHLFNIKPTEQEHHLHRYLLYVATSRAISLMYVCTYLNCHGGYLNHWITQVPSRHYSLASPLKIPRLSFRDHDSKELINGIVELLQELTDEQIDMIYDMLDVREDKMVFTRRIYQNQSHIDRGKDEALFGIFCEELFYLQYCLSRRKLPRKYDLIEMIIESRFIVIDNDQDFRLLKRYVTNNHLTWTTYDGIRYQMPQKIATLIEKYFTRQKEFDECVICTTEFIRIIDINIEDIKETYQRYLSPEQYQYCYRKILHDFFYLIVVQYAYDINHYYYIHRHGKSKRSLLKNGMPLFEEMNKYLYCHYYGCKLDFKIKVSYSPLTLFGEIDLMECYQSNDFIDKIIVEIKCVKEISIKYYIQLLLYNFCYYFERRELDKLFCNKFKILNLLTGLEHNLIIKISPTNMFNLLIILSNVGNLGFRQLNLVYDLETTDIIRLEGPFSSKPEMPRSSVFLRNGHYYCYRYPEIVDIAIKDYCSNMVLINTLVKPTTAILPTVQELTGIVPEMLHQKPDIHAIRAVLKKKMSNFIDCRMLAHNGKRFDQKLLLFYDLIDPSKVSFLDTMQLIPMHLPPTISLKSKSLTKIYQTLFHQEFQAHRAIYDVNALIEIMRHLKMEL